MRYEHDSSVVTHPCVWMAGAAIVFGASALTAIQDPVPDWEQEVTAAVADTPDLVAANTWPVMQLGTLVAPLAIGAVALAAGRRRLALSAVIAGAGAWFIAKGVKEVVGRGRPLAYLTDLAIREGDGSGLGFVSGHSAVAAACAVCLAVALPSRWRPLTAVVAATVGIARIVHGVHFPADVVGGWALGMIIGVATVQLVGIDVADRP